MPTRCFAFLALCQIIDKLTTIDDFIRNRDNVKRILQLIREKWPEYLLEILVIIMGILLALAFNNWNDERKKKMEEQRVLSVLHQEFEGNIEALSTILRSHHNNIELLQNVLPKLNKSAVTTDGMTIISELRQAMYGNTYNPMFGVMNALLNSDEINVIGNEDLKYGLARLPGLLLDYTEEEEVILKVVFEIVIPEMMRIDPAQEYRYNVVLLNMSQQMVPNLENTINEGEGLLAEMNRIASLIKSEMR